jgi:hypothetical protein
MSTLLPPAGRDLRLDLFRGIANWAIFLDHIPNNIVNWLTTRNYGFSDAADLFVFISGYTATFVYARIMLERGFITGATRLLKRAWQIYVAHVFLLAIYLAEIGYLGQKYGNPEFANEFNITGFLRAPAATIYEGLLLRFKPVNMDVLPLYIVLMLVFPPILWVMLRRPNLTLLGSVLLYFAARLFGWNLPGYPSGVWYFNPFTWQLPFMFGAWFALGGALEWRPLIRSPAVVVGGIIYLCFALVMTMAGRFPEFGQLLPAWLCETFNQDKTDLPSYRFIHFCRVGAAGSALLAPRLARSHMAGIPARNRVRAIFALGVLLRNLFVIWCAFRPGRSIGRSRDASARERYGYRLDDGTCLVPVLVEARRSSPAPMDNATPRGTAAGASEPILRQALRSRP